MTRTPTWSSAAVRDLNGQADAGYVQIIWGGPDGLGGGPTPSRQITSQQPFGNAIVAGDQFGHAVDPWRNVAVEATQDTLGIPEASEPGPASGRCTR